MPSPIDIIAIHERTAVGNGVSRPFRCEGDNGLDYFVKLKNAGYECLVKEWVAGRLAQEMGLPVAGLQQVRISPELIAGNAEYEIDLGQGIAFGSLKVEAAERLSLEFIRNEKNEVLSRILLFDWWVKNTDRALSEVGGNPNLLWETGQQRVVMIDHDNTFDMDFDLASFRDYHALRAHGGGWEPSRRDEFSAWLEGGLSHLDTIWAEIPEEWLVNIYGDPQCRLDKHSLNRVLSSFQTNPAFWVNPFHTS